MLARRLVAAEDCAELTGCDLTYSLLSSPGCGSQRVLVLAVENEFTSLVVYRYSRCHSAGVSLRGKRDNFQCRIERISSVHLLEELA
jgi:hypothetical protein